MKFNTVKKIITLFLALTSAFCMISCEDNTRRRPGGGVGYISSTVSDAALSKDKSPLSGEACSEEIATTRPVAVMINNIKESLPQVGISEADIVYEVLAEGGITRLLCVYNDYKNIPEIGSIRSARDYFIDLADAHDAIYVHAGSSTYGTKTLKERKTENIDGFYMGNFTRSPQRVGKMAWEHTLVISGENLTKNIQKKGYRTTIEKAQPLKFHTRDVTHVLNEATHVEIPFQMSEKATPYAVSFFDYDEDTALYNKGHFGQAHVDGDDGSTLAFKNVLVLECEHSAIPGDKLGCISVDFTGTGTGKYFSKGHVIDIVWTKNSRTETYSLFESNGEKPLKINPGKTYIGIVPTGTTVTVEE